MEEEKIFGEKQIGDHRHCGTVGVLGGGSSILPTTNTAVF
jgi:hypothetical protein